MPPATTSLPNRAERVMLHRNRARDLLAEAEVAFETWKTRSINDYGTQCELAAALAVAHEAVAQGLERPA